MGSSRPSDLRISARCAAEVSSDTIWFTGSPAKRNIENEMIPTASMTPTAWIARRRVKASMWSFHVSAEATRLAVEARNEKSRKRLPPGLHLCEYLLFLFGRPEEQDLVVRALGQFHFFRHAPRQRLLVQRNVAVVLCHEFVGLLDHLVALGHIGLQQHLVGQRVELLVAIAAE